MDFIVNDLSFHGQFFNITTFLQSLGRVLRMRTIARRFGRELYCHRNIASTCVMTNMTLQQAIQRLSKDERRAIMGWLTKTGPFWEEERRHSQDEYLECKGEVVTDTAVGEAAYCCLNLSERHLVSLVPSSWDFSPVEVKWYRDNSDVREVLVANYRNSTELGDVLRSAPDAIKSWKDLEQSSRSRCSHLTFLPDCFDPLLGHPFVNSAARLVLRQLETLDRFKAVRGRNSTEGNRLYQEHFTGARSWFSDSSDTEKVEFRNELTFRHPVKAQEKLFCTWHGKVNYHTPIRIHFSWPVRASEPLYVTYIGPKLTLR